MRSSFLCATLFLGCASAGPAPVDVAPEAAEELPRASWEASVRWLESQRDDMARHLGRAHALLLEQAEQAGRDDLLERLSPTPLQPRESGYGLLPEIRPDRAPSTIALREKRYSLEYLTRGFARDFRTAAVLPTWFALGQGDGLDGDVEILEGLQARMRNLESHLEYHRYWQAAMVDEAAYFEERNRLIELVRELHGELGEGGDPERAAELREQVLADVAPFRGSDRIRLREEDSELVLHVPLWTDVEDEAFLDTLRQAVADTFDESAAARARGLRIELELMTVSPTELYPEGPPERGASVDEEAHHARFPEGALVLTTGAASTHAYQGRSMVLGSAPTTPRGLAHEFAHVLGFSDAYLRGFERSNKDRWGHVIVEWVGLQDDLMGDVRAPVTEAMIDRLLEEYGER